jgi:hypothetical protein
MWCDVGFGREGSVQDVESRGESQTYMAEELWGGVGLWVKRDGGERRGGEVRSAVVLYMRVFHVGCLLS